MPDAVIIGGGPAGALAGYLLARSGRDVVIVDRRAAGDEKACGHCLNGRIEPLLDRVGLKSIVLGASLGKTRGICLHVPYRPAINLAADHVSGVGFGWVVDRARLDAALLACAAHAGARVIRRSIGEVWRTGVDGTEIQVRSLDGDCQERLDARVVIGADGLGSRIARALGIADRSCAGSAWAFSFDCRSDDLTRENDERVHMYLARTGYLGIVRRDAGSVHAGALIRRVRGRAPKPGAFLSAIACLHRDCNPAMSRIDLFGSTSIVAAGSMPWTPRKVACPHGALIGDAAGYAEPFSGEGLCWAFESADLLCQLIRGEGARVWSARAARRYEAIWRHRIGRGLFRCRLLAHAIRFPQLTSAVRAIVPASSDLGRLFLTPFWRTLNEKAVA